jgi:serine/threonine protein kinase
LLEACRLDPGRYDPFPLDVYRPERLLGETAWTVRFLCRDRQSQPVIVSALPGLVDQAEAARLFTEMRVFVRVNHPALLPVRGGGYGDPARKARPYMVNAFFAGPTLQEMVSSSGPLSVPDMLAVARPMALGLQTCHAAGIVHGYVNPESLLVARQAGGFAVKLTDVAMPFSALVVPQTILTLATVAGPIVGTMQFLAPEVARGMKDSRTPRADVYSFGATCCFALFRTAQPLRRQWAGIPAPLADLLGRCLEDDPRERPADFGAIVRELAAC